MKDITNRNDKGQRHGYQERYWYNGNLGVKCFYNNGTHVDYVEWYHLKGKLARKTFYI